MEIKVISNTEVGKINFNFDEIREFLQKEMEKFKGLVYNEETIKDAKPDKAKLNNLKKSIDSKRIEAKKEYLKPYDIVELECKELLAIIDEPLSKIDEQVKDYDSARKEDKEIAVLSLYSKYIGDLQNILPYGKIFNDKWCNLSTKLKDVENEIKTIISRVTTDLQVISELNTEFVFDIKNKYLDTLDLSIAMNEKAKLEERKKNFDELKKKEDEQKDEIPTFETPKVVEPVKSFARREEKQFVMLLKVKATEKQLDSLKTFLTDNNIEFAKVKND